MQTKKIIVSNNGDGLDELMELVETTADSMELKKKDKLHLRLLAEETVSLIEAITGEFDAMFWIEEDSGEFRLCLTAKTDVDAGKKRGLLSVSTSGENASAKGVMGKIRDIIENGILNFDEIEKINVENGLNYYSYGDAGMGGLDAASSSLYVWSLSRYRKSVQEASETEAVQEWDELEKSIVANIADEVKVGIKKDRVDMTVYRKF